LSLVLSASHCLALLAGLVRAAASRARNSTRASDILTPPDHLLMALFSLGADQARGALVRRDRPLTLGRREGYLLVGGSCRCLFRRDAGIRTRGRTCPAGPCDATTTERNRRELWGGRKAVLSAVIAFGACTGLKGGTRGASSLAPLRRAWEPNGSRFAERIAERALAQVLQKPDPQPPRLPRGPPPGDRRTVLEGIRAIAIYHKREGDEHLSDQGDQSGWDGNETSIRLINSMTFAALTLSLSTITWSCGR
jgi:hypothetical protein